MHWPKTLAKKSLFASCLPRLREGAFVHTKVLGFINYIIIELPLCRRIEPIRKLPEHARHFVKYLRSNQCFNTFKDFGGGGGQPHLSGTDLPKTG